MPAPRVTRKVLIYATSDLGLLVFDEPDYPNVPLQVPGGTVEPGEALPMAAEREFDEETGLPLRTPLRHLITAPHSYIRDGRRRLLQRSYFHALITGDVPSEWIHIEQTPHNGSAPIRLRLHWIDTRHASTALGLGMGEFLHLLG